MAFDMEDMELTKTNKKVLIVLPFGTTSQVLAKELLNSGKSTIASYYNENRQNCEISLFQIMLFIFSSWKVYVKVTFETYRRIFMLTINYLKEMELLSLAVG